jgi:hypothetical protein
LVVRRVEVARVSVRQPSPETVLEFDLVAEPSGGTDTIPIKRPLSYFATCNT